MTIRVRITNEEGPNGRNIDVIAREGRQGEEYGTFKETSSRILKPQQSAEFYVHLLKDLTIREQHPDLHG